MGKTKAKKVRSKNDVWYVVLAIVIGACLIFGLGVAILQPTGLADYISLHANKAMSSEHYSVNNAQLTYLTYVTYNNYYQSLYSSYGSSVSYFGLDRTKPLSQQSYYASSSMSWLDVCVNDAKTTMSQVLSLCEAARTEGFTLTDEDKATIEKNIQDLKDYAKQNNYSFASAVQAMYGSKGITKGDMKSVMELQLLAGNYAQHLSESYSYTDEQYNAYYEEHKTDYLKADYNTYTVSADYASGATDEEKQAAITAAQDKAEEIFNKVSAGSDFAEVVYEYERELAQAELDAAKAEEEPNEEQITKLQEALDKITLDSVETKLLVTGHQKSSTASEADDWIFADTPANEGSSKLIKGDESATVYQIVKSAYRDEYNTVNMRELDLTLDQFSNIDALKEYAEKILAAFDASSDKSADAFDKLAEQFTTNDITVSSHGEIKETVKSNTTTYPELAEVDEWLFSSERKAGDYKMFVFDDEGAGIYYYESAGRTAWLASVDSDMRSADLDKAVEGFEETYPVTVNDKAIAKIN